MNDSMHSIEEYQGKSTNLNAYNEVPFKSFSRDGDAQGVKTFNMTNSRFEPNFNSDAYKSQAKEIY